MLQQRSNPSQRRELLRRMWLSLLSRCFDRFRVGPPSRDRVHNREMASAASTVAAQATSRVTVELDHPLLTEIRADSAVVDRMFVVPAPVSDVVRVTISLETAHIPHRHSCVLEMLQPLLLLGRRESPRRCTTLLMNRELDDSAAMRRQWKISVVSLPLSTASDIENM